MSVIPSTQLDSHAKPYFGYLLKIKFEEPFIFHIKVFPGHSQIYLQN